MDVPYDWLWTCFILDPIVHADCVVWTGLHRFAICHTGLTSWPSAIDSWEWNVECCMYRAPFPEAFTAHRMLMISIIEAQLMG